MSTTLNLVNYGAILNDSSPIAILANNAAVDSGLNAIAPGNFAFAGSWPGGAITWDGDLYVSRKIQNPFRLVDANGSFPIHFGIVGNGLNTRLINVGPEWAIAISGNLSQTYTPPYTQFVLRDLEIQSHNGPGVFIFGGGKQVVTNNVHITRSVGTGLLYHSMDGAFLRGVTASNISGIGILIVACHHVDFAHVVVKNNHKGLVNNAIDSNLGQDGVNYGGNSAAWNGYLHAERNRFIGVDILRQSKWASMSLGLLYNGPFRSGIQNNYVDLQQVNPQMSATDCNWNEFFGNMGVSTNITLVGDRVSRLMSLYPNHPVMSPIHATRLYGTGPSVTGIRLTHNNPAPLNAITVQTINNRGQNEILIRQSVFTSGISSDFLSGATQSKIYADSTSDPRLSAITMVSGDYIQIYGTISGDKNTYDHYLTNLSTGNIYPVFRIGAAVGPNIVNPYTINHFYFNSRPVPNYSYGPQQFNFINQIRPNNSGTCIVIVDFPHPSGFANTPPTNLQLYIQANIRYIRNTTHI